MAKDAKGHGSEKRGAARGAPTAAAAPVNAFGYLARIAQAHGITGGPFKVQSLNTSLAGKPWATANSYKNRTVAERVAQGMRTDGGYTRVR